MRVRRQSSATWLLLAWAALVVYASLYPFGPWRWPPGLAWQSALSLPWSRYFGWVDLQANLLGYLPLGLLGYAAATRSGWGRVGALALGLLPGPALSFVLESLQYFLPSRVPALSDWLLNSGGAWLGAALGLLLHQLGGLRRWQDVRDHWFQPHSAGALALLALWPVGLLFPAPVPLGLGQWLPHLQAALVDVLAGTPWALQWGDEASEPARALPPGLEAIATGLGLLAPTLVGLSVARPGKRRLALAVGMLLVGGLATAVSTGLNFGPQHAWTWLTLASGPGLAAGVLLGALACLLPRRICAALGLIVLSSLIALVSQAPADPYLEERLQTWELGRFINMYGLAQWLGWIWPFAALAWLLRVIARRES